MNVFPARSRPPLSRSHGTRHLTDTPEALTAFDALRMLSFPALCDVIEAHLEAMPHDQIVPAQLEDLSNKLGRIAHMAARGA